MSEPTERDFLEGTDVWRDAIGRLEGRDDWQGRALAAEAAADGYRQRAERAEHAQREAVKAFQRERAVVVRVEALVEEWAADQGIFSPDSRYTRDVLVREARAALSAPGPVDGSAHHPDTDNAADGHTDTTTGLS